jgi:hypothetical protein
MARVYVARAFAAESDGTQTTRWRAGKAARARREGQAQGRGAGGAAQGHGAAQGRTRLAALLERDGELHLLEQPPLGFAQVEHGERVEQPLGLGLGRLDLLLGHVVECVGGDRRVGRRERRLLRRGRRARRDSRLARGGAASILLEHQLVVVVGAAEEIVGEFCDRLLFEPELLEILAQHLVAHRLEQRHVRNRLCARRAGGVGARREGAQARAGGWDVSVCAHLLLEHLRILAQIQPPQQLAHALRRHRGSCSAASC